MASDRLRLESFLPYRLNVLAETVSQSLARLYSERYGIGIPEWRILATVAQFGEVTATFIGSHSCMHKTKVSRAVAALERKGLLVRRSDDRDHRTAQIGLTAAGIAVYESVVPDARAFSESLLCGLSGDERRQIDELLTRLTERARSLAGEGGGTGGNGAEGRGD